MKKVQRNHGWALYSQRYYSDIWVVYLKSRSIGNNF